jgi:autotransporter-associated beta strand protein
MLSLDSASALGSGALTFSAGNGVTAGIRSSNATARTVGNAVVFSSGNASNTYVFGAATGDLNFTSTANVALGAVVRKFEVNNRTRFAAAFTGTGAGINKTGGGTLILNGTSTYTGGITLTNGTLGGNGALGALSALAGTTVAPGDGGTGTLRTGAVTVAGTLTVEVDGANCDKLLSTGAMDLSGATLTVSLLGSFAGPYVIAEGASVTGTMSVPPGYVVSISGGTQVILSQINASTNFAAWASANNVTGGANGDSDRDGIPNAVEYALNLNPAGFDGAPVDFSGNVVTYHKRAATSGNPDLGYRIEVSSDLGTSAPWTEVAAYLQNDSSIISASVPSGSAKNFARLKIVIAP